MIDIIELRGNGAYLFSVKERSLLLLCEAAVFANNFYDFYNLYCMVKTRLDRTSDVLKRTVCLVLNHVL